MTLPHYANPRDGGNLPRKKRDLGLRWIVANALLIAVLVTYLAMNETVWVENPQCPTEAC